MFDIKLTTTKHQVACGCACLKMLLDYYGIDVNLDTLIEECGLSVNGCSMTTLMRVARLHGLNVVGAWRETPDDVFTQDRPGIVWWKFAHYIVYGGLNDKGEPVIFNPSCGKYAIDKETFAAMASSDMEGTCIVMTNGKPLNITRTAHKNIAEGELFESNGETCIALRPITNGETLRLGWNYNVTTVIDALNAQKEN